MVASDNSRLVALQLGNAYGLLFLAAVAVLYTTTEPKVVRNYLIALLIADIGHVYVCFHVLGPDRFFAVGEWNATTWGNVGATVSRPVRQYDGGDDDDARESSLADLLSRASSLLEWLTC